MGRYFFRDLPLCSSMLKSRIIMASLAQECVTTDCRLTIVDERGLSQLISLPHPGAQCSIIFGTVFEISIFRFNNDISDWSNLLKCFFQQSSSDKKKRATFQVIFLRVLQCVMRHYWSPLYRALTTNLAGRHCCCQNHGYWTLEMRISLINFREPSCNTLCTATLSLGSRQYSSRILKWPKINFIMLNHCFFQVQIQIVIIVA